MLVAMKEGGVTTGAPTGAAIDWSASRSGRMNALMHVVKTASKQQERVVIYCRLGTSMDAIEECLRCEAAVGSNTAEDKGLQWVRVDEFKRQQAKRGKALHHIQSGEGWSVCIHAVKAVDDFVSLPTDISHVILVDSDKSLGMETGRFSKESILRGVLNVNHDPGEVKVYSFSESH